MPRKGMRSICFHPKTASFASPSRNSPSFPTPTRTESAMEKIIDSAELLISKWDPESSTYARVTSLFYESKREAMQFIKCVNDLQKAMHLLLPEAANAASEKLVRGQRLMEIAMKRLQKEFYQILSTNRAQLDPESVSARSSRVSARSSTSDYNSDDGDEIRLAGESIAEVEEAASIAMADLKSIADCMISSGYAKECIGIYKIIRKSIVDEGIYRLGVEKWTSSRINKMDWEVLELKIKSWLEAVKISMRTLFVGEKILCDHVFGASDDISESCFSAISGDGATLLFGFPEKIMANKAMKSPEKIFRLLDMYTAISDNWPLIDSVFAFDSTSAVRTQALNSLVRIGASVRDLVTDFETSIQKDSSKSPVSGGGVHPLTAYAMNYLSIIADYSNIVADIFADWPAPARSSLPESYFDSPSSDEAPTPAFSLRVAWLILVLLCKLDGKAKQYDAVSLSYLFLANNLQHVVHKVRTSNLQYLLGEEWIDRQNNKVREFAASYERLAWGKVFESLPGNTAVVLSPAEAKRHFVKFNSSFEEAYRRHSSSTVDDENLREEIKASVETKLVRAYTVFYTAHRRVAGAALIVRYSPEDIGNYLSDFFSGSGDQATTSSSSSSSSSHSHWWLLARRRRL